MMDRDRAHHARLLDRGTRMVEWRQSTKIKSTTAPISRVHKPTIVFPVTNDWRVRIKPIPKTFSYGLLDEVKTYANV